MSRFLRAFSLFAACLLGLAISSATAQEQIYVTNANSSSVTVYVRTGTGNLAPLRTLVGAATGLNNPSGLAVDKVNNELLVVNNGMPHSVTVYARTAAGNTAPLRTITGNVTAFNGPRGLSVDAVNNEIAVANRVDHTVTIYSRTANGNVAPVRTISGPGTLLSSPWGVVVDTTNNEILVANNGGLLTVYARTANGNAVPVRSISGANTGFNNGPIGVTVDTVNNEVAVTNPFTGMAFQPAVLVFGRTDMGNVAPTRTIVGASTGLSSPGGLAVDPAHNELLVPNSLINSVTVYARTANGNVAPVRTIAGAATLLNNPQFLAVTTGTAALDVDADGAVEPLTDGLLLLRYFFGFRGSTLVSGAVDLVNCSRCDAPSIEAYVGGLGSVLDIDDDESVEPLTDCLLVLRYAFGFRGSTLINGAVGANCSRCDAAVIEAYIAGLV